MLSLSFDPHEDLLSIATAHARDVDALCLGAAAIIFPSATLSPSEAMISAVSVKLLQLVRDIEVKLAGNAREPNSWPLLVRSGFFAKRRWSSLPWRGDRLNPAICGARTIG